MPGIGWSWGLGLILLTSFSATVPNGGWTRFGLEVEKGGTLSGGSGVD